MKKKNLNIFKNKVVLLLFTATIISTIYVSWGIWSWKFSYVGDEWAFFEFARYVAQEKLLLNPFKADGVYSQYFILGSLYQGLFLLFYDSFIAWKLSSTLLIIPISFFFYKFIKSLLGTQNAIYSTIILQSSFFIANYLKIAYLNSLSFALFVASLYFAEKWRKKPIATNSINLALCLGLSLFIYIGPIFPILISPLLLGGLISILRNSSKKITPSIILPTIIFSTFVLLVVLQYQLVGEMRDKTVYNKEYNGIEPMVINILRNFTLFFNNYDYFYNHFISGPYFDTISQILILMGFLSLTVKKYFTINHLYIVLLFIACCATIGVTSPYWYSPTTRGIFFIPFGAIFGGIGLAFIANKIKRKVNLNFFVIPILTIIFLLNIYKSQIGTFSSSGYSITSLILKEVLERDNQVILLLKNDTDYSYDAAHRVIAEYSNNRKNLEVKKISEFNCDVVYGKTVLILESENNIIQEVKTRNCMDPIEIYIISTKLFI